MPAPPQLQVQQVAAVPVVDTGIPPQPKPNMKLKGLFWTKLNERAQEYYQSIWYTKIPSNPEASVVRFEKLYELFEDIVKPKEVKAEVEEKKDELIALIQDEKRQQAIYLSVKKLLQTNKLTYDQIRKMAMQLDDSVIGFDGLCSLAFIAPTREEITAINDYDGEYDKLDLPSQWLYEVKTIPRFKQRIEMFEFSQSFEKYYNGNHPFCRN